MIICDGEQNERNYSCGWVWLRLYMLTKVMSKQIFLQFVMRSTIEKTKIRNKHGWLLETKFADRIQKTI